MWLKGGLAKGGAGTRSSPQSPSQPACRPSISLQQHRVLNVSGLHGRTLKQKWIAGSNLLLECRQPKALSANKKRHYPHEARTAILAIWVWRVRWKRRKWRFSDLFLAAVSGTSHDRTAKTAKKTIVAILVWRAYMPQWTANLAILTRNSRKDSKARSTANQLLPSDWRLCKCGRVIPRWLPTRFAQTLIEESGEQN